MKSLPADLLPHFLEPLQNDRESLKNCLFVNRFWCRTTSRILWRNPFAMLPKVDPNSASWHSNNNQRQQKSENKMINRQKERLILTYTMCLLPEEKSALLKILLPLKDHVLLHQLINNYNYSRYSSRPTFRYERYLETLNDTSLFSAIKATFEPLNRRGKSTTCEEIQTFQIFMKMFITRATKFRQIGLETIFTKNPLFVNAADDIMQTISRRQKKIHSISLLFKQQQPLQNYYILNNNSRINAINFERKGTIINLDSIITLIKSQRNLENFWIESARDDDLTQVLVALRQHHSRTLQTLLFSKCSFSRLVPADYFAAFVNLRELVFSESDGVRGIESIWKEGFKSFAIQFLIRIQRYSNNETIETTDGDKLKNVIMAQNELEWLELSLLASTTISSGLQSSSHIFGAIRFYKINRSLFRTCEIFMKLEFLVIGGTFGQMPLAFIKHIIEKRIAMVAELLPFTLIHAQHLRALELNLEQLSSLLEPSSCRLLYFNYNDR
ncbi:6440_t:CDS:2 [Ambispora gerdemannii]|uniref:6440_t:CDS:1 n=1 Tax=Ambispora gerdemannii TaxID=144530 RepID=A0A9N9B389_9GLOM|nr:6440_t:CDS:2 [Ambispora gerdemannii]